MGSLHKRPAAFFIDYYILEKWVSKIIGILIVLLIAILLISLIIYVTWHNKKIGLIETASGYTYLSGVDSYKRSTIYLFKDRMTINNIQIIPIAQITNASFYVRDQSFTYRGSRIMREFYILSVGFKAIDGHTSSFTCESKENLLTAQLSMRRRSGFTATWR